MLSAEPFPVLYNDSMEALFQGFFREIGAMYYKHTQKGPVLAGGLFGTALFVVVLWARNNRNLGTLFIGVLLIILGLFFSSMTVEVTDDRMVVFFGPGFLGRRFHLEQIRGVRRVRNPWYYGWGIHVTPHGWLYNVSGFDSVEIELSSGKTHRIGTDDPEKLIEAIRTRKEA